MSLPTLVEYFDYWSSPDFNGLRGEPFIQHYLAYGCGLSLRLLIPANWRKLYLPGQTPCSGGEGNPFFLPASLRAVIERLGFIPDQNERIFGPNGERSYVLRPHSFSITVASYRTQMLPYLFAFEGTKNHPNEKIRNYTGVLHYEKIVHLAERDAHNPHDNMQAISRRRSSSVSL
ncbi:hypothetical protein WKW50_23595 [Ochrobactrum sp. GPK 3]